MGALPELRVGGRFRFERTKGGRSEIVEISRALGPHPYTGEELFAFRSQDGETYMVSTASCAVFDRSAAEIGVLHVIQASSLDREKMHDEITLDEWRMKVAKAMGW